MTKEKRKRGRPPIDNPMVRMPDMKVTKQHQNGQAKPSLRG